MSSTVNVLTNSRKIFHITRNSFSLLIAFAVINEYGKGADVQIFGPFPVLFVEGSFQTGLFRHLPNHVFRRP